MKNLILTIVIAVTMCSCTHTWDYPPIIDTSHKYYVIDINSDVPAAFFETYEEASVYQKDFAEHHEYVIVKTKENYSVYNMEPKINLSEEKYKK